MLNTQCATIELWMHSGDCWARTEMVRVSPGVEERNSSSFQRNVIIDNLPIVLTFRHSIEEFSGQSRFHVFLLLLLLLVFFFQNTWKISIWKKKGKWVTKISFNYSMWLSFSFTVFLWKRNSYLKTLSIGPAPGIEHATSRSAIKRSTDWATKHSIIFYRQTLMEEGLEIWLHWTHARQKEVSQWPPDQAVPFPRFLGILLMKE